MIIIEQMKKLKRQEKVEQRRIILMTEIENQCRDR